MLALWLMAFAITVGFVEDDDADPPDDLDPASDEPADHSADVCRAFALDPGEQLIRRSGHPETEAAIELSTSAALAATQSSRSSAPADTSGKPSRSKSARPADAGYRLSRLLLRDPRRRTGFPRRSGSPPVGSDTARARS
ncbi:MAG TPA: hypothetical protein VGX23_33870 [Actinocrinis sp.]|nr:hypothetical protein [Actinocrinis sp.]